MARTWMAYIAGNTAQVELPTLINPDPDFLGAQGARHGGYARFYQTVSATPNSFHFAIPTIMALTPAFATLGPGRRRQRASPQPIQIGWDSDLSVSAVTVLYSTASARVTRLTVTDGNRIIATIPNSDPNPNQTEAEAGAELQPPKPVTLALGVSVEVEFLAIAILPGGGVQYPYVDFISVGARFEEP